MSEHNASIQTWLEHIRFLSEEIGPQTAISSGNTEMADGLRTGIPAITFTGCGPSGKRPIGTCWRIPTIRWMQKL